jgi:PHP family Zn ribbon phosphoesterase
MSHMIAQFFRGAFAGISKSLCLYGFHLEKNGKYYNGPCYACQEQILLVESKKYNICITRQIILEGNRTRGGGLCPQKQSEGGGS